jgi:hypothetical protein
LHAETQFSRERHRAFIDASVTALDKVRLHDGPRASNADPAPVFIVGRLHLVRPTNCWLRAESRRPRAEGRRLAGAGSRESAAMRRNRLIKCFTAPATIL